MRDRKRGQCKQRERQRERDRERETRGRMERQISLYSVTLMASEHSSNKRPCPGRALEMREWERPQSETLEKRFLVIC